MWNKRDPQNNIVVIIHIPNEKKFYPLSDHLNPGQLTIGDPLNQGFYHNLLLLDWMIAYFQYFGFSEFQIVSEYPTKSMESFYRKDGNIIFFNSTLGDYFNNNESPKSKIVLTNLGYFSNIDLGKSLIEFGVLKADAGILVVEGAKYTVGLLEEKENEVVKFLEKPFDKLVKVTTNLLLLESSIIRKLDINSDLKVHQLVSKLFEQGILKSLMANAIDNELWTENIDSIEYIIKMNPRKFIEKMSFLYKET